MAALVGEGLGVPEVAARLGIAPGTAKQHLGQCFEKTGLRSQLRLARLLGAMATPQGGRQA